MKITLSGKTLAISAAIVLTIAAVSYVKSSPLCQNNIDNAATACNNLQQNWLGWIKGDSRSTQFHFVDFLELLNRLTPNNTNSN